VARKVSGHDEFCWRSSPTLSIRKEKEVCSEVWSWEGVDEDAMSSATSWQPGPAKQLRSRVRGGMRNGCACCGAGVHSPPTKHCRQAYPSLFYFFKLLHYFKWKSNFGQNKVCSEF